MGESGVEPVPDPDGDGAVETGFSHRLRIGGVPGGGVAEYELASVAGRAAPGAGLTCSLLGQRSLARGLVDDRVEVVSVFLVGRDLAEVHGAAGQQFVDAYDVVAVGDGFAGRPVFQPFRCHPPIHLVTAFIAYCESMRTSSGTAGSVASSTNSSNAVSSATLLVALPSCPAFHDSG